MNGENNFLMVVRDEDETTIEVVEAMEKQETHEVANGFSKLEKKKWRRML